MNGDFVESQAFAFLAVRSLMNLPISFPNTTGCKHPSLGGKLLKIKLKQFFLLNIFQFLLIILFLFIFKK